jgi:hypothetical protein
VNTILRKKCSTAIILLLLTAAALLIHGYHPYAEDAEIYLPGIERILNPHLFPEGRQFFQSHASLTLFPNLVAWSLQLTHLPLEWGLFLWHISSIFLLLLGCWELSSLLFPSARTRWGAVCLITALLTLPVAGTALYLVDQYLNPRNLAAFAEVFALARMLEKKYMPAAAWLIFALIVHPLMGMFPLSLCTLWIVLEKLDARPEHDLAERSAAVVYLLFPLIPLAPQASAAYHEAAKLHANHYIQHWEWYEWLGIFAPLALLWYFGQAARARQWLVLARTCRAFAVYGLIYFLAALIVDLPPRFETLARLQPLRSLHFLYLFLFLCVGGFLAEYVLNDRMWRWLLLLVPLALGMFAVQRSLFPATAHIEWPGHAPRNPWEQSFLWVRQNTPPDAVFALDPWYMEIRGEDDIGFRCLAQRSRLADAVKDNGVVSMFPSLAEEWWEQVQAQTPWKNFQLSDFARLKEKYGVSWVVLQHPGLAGLDCEYQNSAVRVCRVP